MIDPLTTWQQVTDALSGPAQPGTDAAQAAPQEDFDTAFSVLDLAIEEADRQRQPAASRAELRLYLASLHALYGDVASDETQLTLAEAARLSPDVREQPLFLALSAELDARLRGPEATYPDVRAVHGDPLSRFHTHVGPRASRTAGRRRWTCTCRCRTCPRTSAGDCAAGRRTARRTSGTPRRPCTCTPKRPASRAACRAPACCRNRRHCTCSSASRWSAAILERARTLYPDLGDLSGTLDPDATAGALGLASWHYLMAQALLNQDQTDAALERIQEADRLERLAGDPSYGVALVYGQVLVAQARQSDAIPHFDQALALAGPEDRPYALHELGVAFLDLDRSPTAHREAEDCQGTQG